MSCIRFRSFPSKRANKFLRGCSQVGLIVVLAFVSSAFAGSEVAAVIPVTGIGPGMTRINEIAVDPSQPQVAYAATGAGVYKTVDGGITWADSSLGLPQESIYGIAVDPARANILYATGGNIYKSTDSGAHWASTGTKDIPGMAISVVVDPFDRRTLYVGTQAVTMCCGLYGMGVAKSTDGGASWTALENIGGITALAADPIHPNTLYADGCFGRNEKCTFYKSTNGGTDWIPATTDLPSTSSVMDLAIAPDNPDRLYAALGYPWVFISLDGGTNWITNTVGITSSVQTLEINPLAPSTLVAGTEAGIFKSMDRAGTWRRISADSSLRSVSALAYAPADPGTLFAGTNKNGIFQSTDGGESWSPAASGLPNAISVVGEIELDAGQPANLYALTYLGLMKTADYGEHWSDAFPGFLPYDITTLAIHPADPMTIYLGTRDQGILKSMNGGAGWVPANTGYPSSWVDLLAVHPEAPETVFAIGGKRLYRTSDGGGHWQAIYTLPETYFGGVDLEFDPVSPNTLYLAFDRIIAKTTDGGTQWSNLSLPIPATSGAIIQALVIDPSNPLVLYAGTGQLWGNGVEERGAVYKTRNGGKNWSRVTRGLPAGSIWELAIDPVNPSVLYAGVSQALYKTTTGGSSWRPVPGYALQKGGYIHDMLFDPRNPKRLLVGSDRGVFLVGAGRYSVYLPFNHR